MHVVIDIEANGLKNPDRIWVIVCRDVTSGVIEIFRGEGTDGIQNEEKERFKQYASRVTRWIGHNILEYDLPVLVRFGFLAFPDISNVTDTLIVSRLVDYSRPNGHSIEAYGEDLGLLKGKNHYQDFFKAYSKELEEYCVRDVHICDRIYSRYLRIINSPDWQQAIWLEHRFQLIVNDLHNNGFAFNVARANVLLGNVTQQLKELDDKILEAFPPKEKVIREFTPKLTKFGTISRTSVPRVLHGEIHLYEAGRVYKQTKLEPFNPSSHKQLIEVLNEAGWKPENKTQTHIDTERALIIASKIKAPETVDLKTKLDKLKISGWKIDEHNLSTLPEGAPEPSRLLAKRILLESRRRTLTEWLTLVEDDGRVHGKFYGIGAWTHRMAHREPNMANIPREFKEDGSTKLLGKEMRELWIAPPRRLLVGVDAEGIQLRIFAHYVDDEEFTDALVKGKKSDKSDPHSLNQRILGPACKTRQAAKRFIYALVLGAGLGKLAEILGCSRDQAKEALDRLLQRYEGFAYLKEKVIPNDAKLGYFKGLDGRLVPIPGQTKRDREHLCMSGYLQNGEGVIVKRAAIEIDDILVEEKSLKKWMFVNIVHDELQSETRNDWYLAKKVARIKAEAIKLAGEYYKTKCPMAGSYWNDDHNEYTIGKNWYATH